MNDVSLKPSWRLDTQAARALALGAHADPFAVLGPHEYAPTGASCAPSCPAPVKVDILRRANACLMASLEPGGESGLFENLVPGPTPYLLRIVWPAPRKKRRIHILSVLLLGDLDLHLFNEGRHFELAHCLGAQSMTVDGVNGVRFAVWAPNATRVAVVGDFDSWDSPAPSNAGATPCRHLGTVPSRASQRVRTINMTFAGRAASINPGKRIPSPVRANLLLDTASVVPSPDLIAGATK